MSSPELNKFFKAASLVAILLSLFLVVRVISDLKDFRYIGSGVYPQNVISVSGTGEVFAVPDVATVSFSITEERATASETQAAVTEKMNSLLGELKQKGLEEKDIKTIGYNLSPRYEYANFVSGYRIPSNERVLVGYELSHSISLKIRNLDKVGEIISVLGGANVSNISGPDFLVDNKESHKAEARKMAIEEAQKKAKDLSRDLGVKLVRMVNFSESGDFYPYGLGGDFMNEAVLKSEATPVPGIPAGENKIISQVHITYEIR